MVNKNAATLELAINIVNGAQSLSQHKLNIYKYYQVKIGYFITKIAEYKYYFKLKWYHKGALPSTSRLFVPSFSFGWVLGRVGAVLNSTYKDFQQHQLDLPELKILMSDITNMLQTETCPFAYVDMVNICNEFSMGAFELNGEATRYRKEHARWICIYTSAYVFTGEYLSTASRTTRCCHIEYWIYINTHSYGEYVHHMMI